MAASTASSANCGGQPDHRTGRYAAHSASVDRCRTDGARIRARVRFISGLRRMTPVRSDALAFWLREPGVGEIRPVPLPEPGPDEVLVRTLHSGVSRGTETLVFRGGVPASQYAAMRAPFQDGDFPGPVKYGYLNVGVVEAGSGAVARPHRVLPVPAPDRLRRAGPGRGRRARRRAAGPGGARRHGGDRGQRAVGRRAAASATGSPSSAPAWSAAASRACWPGFPASR